MRGDHSRVTRCLRTTAASFRDNEASISERVLLSYAARRVIVPAGTGLGTPAAVKVVRTTSFWNAGSSAMSGCMIMSGAAMSTKSDAKEVRTRPFLYVTPGESYAALRVAVRMLSGTRAGWSRTHDALYRVIWLRNSTHL